jgi:cysteine desulfurase / selenocysteine lyase
MAARSGSDTSGRRRLADPGTRLSPTLAPTQLTRRRVLALGAAAVSAGGLIARAAGAQGFSQAPIVPKEARGDLEHRFWRDLFDEFPIELGPRYFDTAELGIPPLDALERMHRVAREVAAGAWATAAELVGSARQTVAHFLGAEPKEIALAADTATAMGLLADALPLASGTVVLTTHEPPSSYMPWVARAREGQVRLRFVPPTSLAAGDKSALDGAAAVVFSHVLPTSGLIMPAADICARARKAGALALVNGACAAGIQPVDLHALDSDAYVTSGCGWLLGPQGTAVAHVRQELLSRLRPRYQDPTRDAASSSNAGPAPAEARELEPAPPSPTLAAGLAAALEWLGSLGVDPVRERATALAQRLYWGLTPIQGIEVWSSADSVAQSPIVSFRVTRRPNTQVADWLLERHQVRVQRIDTRGMNAVRASPHLVNTPADVDRLIEGARTLA